MSLNYVDRDIIDGTAVLRLRMENDDALASRNVINQLLDALVLTLESGAEGVVLTGSGSVFFGREEQESAGGKLARGWEEVINSDEHLSLMKKLRTMNIPLVVAVNGATFDLGVNLVCVADYVVAVPDAFFQHTYVDGAAIPAGGSTWLLPRKIGHRRAVEMSLLGEEIGAIQDAEGYRS